MSWSSKSIKAAAVMIVAAVAVAMGGAAAITSTTPGSVAQPIKRIPGTNDEMPVGSLGNDPAAIRHGRYLVTILGCNDCHTPFKMTERGPEPDMSRMLSGHPESIKLNASDVKLDPSKGWMWAGNATNTAFAGPWGVTYACNLTPDIMSGIGIWTEQTFISAIRNGRHWGTARPIMPPMPWQAFSNMTDRDLKSIYACLRTIPPVSNNVPDYEPPR